MARKPAPLRPHDATAGPLAERAFPELAEALRSGTKPVLRAWEKQVLQHVRPAREADAAAVIDGLPGILAAMVGALASGEAAEVRRLVERSPEQGIHRFEIHYAATDVTTEDRILRKLVLEQVDAALGRRTTVEENVALNWAVDLMVQQAIVAFVDHQGAKLREAAEAELKYLSFLSHDLSGHLGSVTLWLQILRTELAGDPKFAGHTESLDAVQQAVLGTMGGMGRLLQAERLRHTNVGEPKAAPVDLHALAGTVAAPFVRKAEEKGVRLAVAVPPDAAVSSDGEMIRLALQNLIGNAVKYSTRGTVRVCAERPDGRWLLSVADEGPGIAPERVGQIFEAFQRGEMHGQQGVGLGLAIAARAAKLLRAELTVESQVGVGSTFRLAFPPATPLKT